MNDKTNPQAVSRSSDHQGSLYWSDVRRRAQAEGRSTADVVAEDVRSALDDPPEVGEECLLPDEAEALLQVPDLEVTPQGLKLVDRDHLDAANLAAYLHASSCEFCRAMLLSMQPAAADERRFLAAIRKAATGERALGVVRNAWLLPSAFPIAIAMLATVIFFVTEESPAAALISTWRLLAAAFAAASIAFLIVRFLPTPKGISRMISAGPAWTRTATQTAVLVVPSVLLTSAAILSAYRLEQRIDNSREEAARALAKAMIEASNASSDNPLSSINTDLLTLLTKDRFESKGGGLLELKGTPGIPGCIVAKVDERGARVSWEVYGKRLDPVLLQVRAVPLTPPPTNVETKGSFEMLAAEAIRTKFVRSVVASKEGEQAFRVVMRSAD